MRDTTSEWMYLIRILLACICGGMIGYERTNRGKGAGIRTHIIVYLAFIILFNFSDDDVIFFFSDYYSNYCEFDESTNYLYKLSALYLDIDE